MNYIYSKDLAAICNDLYVSPFSVRSGLLSNTLLMTFWSHVSHSECFYQMASFSVQRLLQSLTEFKCDRRTEGLTTLCNICSDSLHLWCF